ncbi:MAG: hypothetical protein KF745_12140 [Phycisphaeraceae bacterium]|nr:hypothetical protein [Phycisphaeraceae bacterium]
MMGPGARRAAWAATLVLAGAAASAPAQLLNLNSPAAPAPGEGRAAIALRAQMRREINDRLAVATEEIEGDVIGARVGVSVRRLIAALAIKGEALGEAGSAHLLAARTLTNRLVEVDAIAAWLGADGDEARRAVAETLFNATTRLAVPATQPELDAWLWELLSPLVDAAWESGPNALWVGRWERGDLTATLIDLARSRTGGSDRAVRNARDSLVAAGQRGRGDAVGVFERALELLAQRRSLGGSVGVIREARPAWRVLEQVSRRDETELWEMLAGIGSKLMSPADMGTDPSIVAVLASVQRDNANLADLRATSRALTLEPKGPFAASPAGIRLARLRLLRIGQAMTKPPTAAAANDELLESIAVVARIAAVPGEAEARMAANADGEGAAAWKAVSGDKAAELAAAIDEARSEWIEAWGRGAEAAAAAERLDRLRSAMSMVATAAVVFRLRDAAVAGDRSGVQSWPGWELSPMALNTLAVEAQRISEKAVAAAFDVKSTEGEAAQKEWEGGVGPAAGVLAALDAAARAAGVLGAGPLAEVASAPDASGDAGVRLWMVASRADCAAVCRYLEEWAAASVPPFASSPRRAALLQYVNARAGQVRRGVGEARQP